MSPVSEYAEGAAVFGTDGAVATVRGVALAPATLEATWLVLDVLGGDHVTAVPTTAASVDGAGVVRVPFTKKVLLGAPVVGDAVDGPLATALRTALGLA